MDEDTRIGEYLTALYRVVWITWYHSQASTKPAEMIVEFIDGDDGYDRDTHRLTLRLSEHNRDDVLQAIRSGFNHHEQIDNWPAWFTSLVHEMIHEYQYCVLNDAVTPEGKVLFDNPPKRWDGPGHGAGFYAAIANRAAFMEVPADQLCQRL